MYNCCKKDIDLNTKKQILLVSLVVLILVGIVSVVLQNKLQMLKTQEYMRNTAEIKKEVNTFVQDKQKSTMAISIALSRANIILKSLNKINEQENKNNLFLLSEAIKNNTNYKNVWIQVLDAQGVSVLRSWTDKKGDYLVNARADLKKLLKNPHPISTISTGKFSISFKSIVPIYANKTLLGFVEVITHFNSLTQDLKLKGYNSLLLVDKRYKNQLTYNISHKFIDDYYVANFQSDDDIIQFIAQIGVENIIENKKSYMIQNDFLITHTVIKDIQNRPMAYYILLKDTHYLTYKISHEFNNLIRNILVFGLFFIAFLGFIFYRRNKDINAQKNYFHNIVDTASEIIIIIQDNQAIDANKAFFDFFHEYKDFKEFHNHHDCICDLFIEEEGFISTTMGNQTWVEYVYLNQQLDNKIKLLHENKVYVFTVSIQTIPPENGKKETYTLALTDITRMEEYKNELELMSKTDTLTAIGNRYYFNTQIEHEFARAKRYTSDLSMVMLDIDFFKNVNDTYGHDVGDKVLVTLTKEINHFLRNSDIFCRYGGEEFMILMPESSALEADISAQRIRKHIENLDIPPLKQLTISLGVTQLLESDTIESFAKRVDEALYTSKKDGRNRVTLL